MSARIKPKRIVCDRLPVWFLQTHPYTMETLHEQIENVLIEMNDSIDELQPGESITFTVKVDAMTDDQIDNWWIQEHGSCLGRYESR